VPDAMFAITTHQPTSCIVTDCNRQEKRGKQLNTSAQIYSAS